MSSPDRRTVLWSALMAPLAWLAGGCGSQAGRPNTTSENCSACSGTGRVSGACAVCNGSGSRGYGPADPVLVVRRVRERVDELPLVRGRKPHDPQFDVREALYFVTGVDLTAIEGIDELHALTLVSELGADFSKWPTVKQFTAWLGLCPTWKKTGGKVQSSRTRLGKNRAAGALRLAAWALLRSTSYLGAYLRRQRARLGCPKAITAAAHKLARIVYHLIRGGTAYLKQTEEAYARQVRDRLEKQLVRRARELGYEVKKIEPVEPTGSAGPAVVS